MEYIIKTQEIETKTVRGSYYVATMFEAGTDKEIAKSMGNTELDAASNAAIQAANKEYRQIAQSRQT